MIAALSLFSFMSKLICLLMVRNEADIIRQTFEVYARVCDSVFVIDGSDPGEGTSEYLRDHPKVEYYTRDRDQPKNLKEKITDHIRLPTFREICRRYEDGVVLFGHGDELWLDHDPRVLASQIEKDWTIVRSIWFFLHTSQKVGYVYDQHKPVQDQIRWCAFPGCWEPRLLKITPEAPEYYNALLDRNSDALKRIYSEKIVPECFRHYSYRSPLQVYQKALDRSEVGTGFQLYHKWAVNADCFVDCPPIPAVYGDVEARIQEVLPGQRIVDGELGIVE